MGGGGERSWPPATDHAHASLIAAVRRELAARADRERAAQMQRYAKSAMPCYGVAARPMREACRAAFTAHPLASFEEWHDTALALWRGAGHREERYAAIELAGWRRYRHWLTPAALPMLEEMIVTGAWWDLVDGIAPHLVGHLLRAHGEQVRPVVLEWARDDDIWRRRSAIICQLTLKHDTDLDLLERCIEPSLGRKELFLRKAIGWALRQHARTDPDWVRAYVRTHADSLSPLSRREALRHIS